MNIKCLFGHKWNGCKCERCGATRDEGHKWTSLEGKCIEKCSVCGKEHSIEHKWSGCKCEKCGITREEGHNWSIVEGKCIEKCSICGVERSVKHKWNWNDNKCSRCGEINNFERFDWVAEELKELFLKQDTDGIKKVALLFGKYSMSEIAARFARKTNSKDANTLCYLWDGINDWHYQ